MSARGGVIQSRIRTIPKEVFYIVVANLALFSGVTSLLARKHWSRSLNVTFGLAVIVLCSFFVVVGSLLMSPAAGAVRQFATCAFVFACPYSFVYAWNTRVEDGESKRGQIAFGSSAFFMIVWGWLVLDALSECVSLLMKVF